MIVWLQMLLLPACCQISDGEDIKSLYKCLQVSSDSATLIMARVVQLKRLTVIPPSHFIFLLMQEAADSIPSFIFIRNVRNSPALPLIRFTITH